MDYVKVTPIQTVVPGWLRVGTKGGNGVYQRPDGEVVARREFDRAKKQYLESSNMNEETAREEMRGNGEMQDFEETVEPEAAPEPAKAKRARKPRESAKVREPKVAAPKAPKFGEDGKPVMPWFPTWGEGKGNQGYGRVALKLRAALDADDAVAAEAVKANSTGNSYHRALGAYKAAILEYFAGRQENSGP